jgi:hypothetical protein
MNPLIQLKKAAPVFLVAVVCFRLFADNASGQTPTPTSTPTPTPTPIATGFVIGDLDAVVGNHVTFWGAQWSRLNHLSGGPAPASFKGFANSPNPNPPACGGTWQSAPGNSSGPPESVPSDITVIVSSLVTKSGPIISGDVPEMVIVHTDPGYEPNPGHEGTGTVTAVVCQSVPNDFNNDGYPDYLLYNPSTRQTAIWYMRNNVHVNGSFGPTLPEGWQVLGVADFNRHGHPDYLLFNSATRATVIWYMNNNVHVTGTHGPTLPAGWSVAGVADFNRHGHPDYLLFNSATRATVIWYMNNNVHVTGTHGPTLPAGWSVAGVADFNGDGHPDYLLFNANSGATVIWYMNNNVHVTGAYGPTLPAGWEVAGVADFNRDGHPDYLLFNPTTRGTVIWYMNNNIHVTSIYGPTLPAGWSVVAP